MFMTKKDRKIANQEAMISNRNKLIEDLQARNRMSTESNAMLRSENEDLKHLKLQEEHKRRQLQSMQDEAINILNGLREDKDKVEKLKELFNSGCKQDK